MRLAQILRKYLAESFQRKLMCDRERLSLALEVSRLALYDWDLTTGRVYLSARWSEMLGGPAQPREYSTAELMAMVHPDDVAAINEAVHRMIKGEVADYDLQYRVRDASGKWIWVHSRGRVVRRDPAGKALRMTGTNAVITEQRERHAELEQARLLAESANRAKSQFLANMSHEIRTPMNGVLGMTELLLQTELSERQRRLADTVRQSGTTLLAVINDILDYSRIEAGKLEIDRIPFDLHRVVADALELFAEPALAKRLELINDMEPDLPCSLKGDPGRLAQVLSNLLANAIKFTDGGEVVLRIVAVTRSVREAVLRFEVSDTGIGIEPENLDRVFHAFRQGDGSSTRRHGGAGLGLTICKQLVELMGGEIGLRSRVGQGSTFWFMVPFERVADSDAGMQTRRTRLRGLRVLVVDDNSTNRDILCDTLNTEGLHADSAQSGAQALDMLQSALARDPYRVAVLDMHMPQMDGLELARHIRGDAALAGTQLLMLSSVGQDVRTAELREIGIRRWLAKPVRQAELIASLDALLDGDNDPATPPKAVPRPAASRRDAYILLVEDNAVNQAVGKEMLKGLGYECDIAPHGRAAIDAVRGRRYALVLMDCQMSEMDGFDATRAIRALEARGEPLAQGGRRLPIVALTALALEGDREKCLEAGMDGYIVKPFDQSHLDLEIQRHLAAGASGPEGAAVPVAAPMRPTVTTRATGDALDAAALEALRALDKDGTRGVVRRVLDIYLKASPALVAEIREGAAMDDWKRVGRAAHSLKSSSRNVGAARLSEVCRELERASGEGRVADSGSLVAQVLNAYADTEKLVREQLDGGGT